MSEVTSTKGTNAIIDQVSFTRSVTAIRQSCSDLSNPAVDRNDVSRNESVDCIEIFFSKILTFATTIAKHTSNLCNISREASSNTTNPVARRHFVQSAKDVANGTAELVRKIKVGLDFRSISISLEFIDRFWTVPIRKKIIDIVSKSLVYYFNRSMNCTHMRCPRNSPVFQRRSVQR